MELIGNNIFMKGQYDEGKGKINVSEASGAGAGYYGVSGCSGYISELNTLYTCLPRFPIKLIVILKITGLC